jgi:MoaA/NifB/PqqE/SkfB family radical SAM enzyme
MKKSFWKQLFWGSQGKPYSAWQIELTTRCPLRCRMCCREGHHDMARQDMPFENFQRLAPYFKNVEAVVLEGWGESLLHPRLIDCIRLVKQEGSRVGFVTSGKTLNEAYIAELVKAGPDFIGFSLSGASPQTHDAIRVNSSLAELTRHIHIFQETKARLGKADPRFHIVYLLLRNNIHELPLLLRLAKELKIEEVILIHIALVTTPWQAEQRVFADTPNPEYEAILQEGERLAKELKIQYRRPSLTPRDVPVCSENPLQNLYISVKGNVSPCVYLNPPLPTPFTRLFQGRSHTLEKLKYGNIFTDPFAAVWERKEYAEFRKCFSLRQQTFPDYYSSLLDPDKMKAGGGTPFPPPPVPCQTCYKILGY